MFSGIQKSKPLLRKKNIKIVLFPNCLLMDVTGPVSIFEAANYVLPENLGYLISFIGTQNGVVPTSGSISIPVTGNVADETLEDVDLLLIPGGNPGTKEAMKNADLLNLIRKANDAHTTIASICTGSFILAQAGVLQNIKCATHWGEIKNFKKLFPKTNIQSDVIYQKEDNIWTSAGVSTGIDMALAIVAEDLGTEIALRVARNFVLHSIRPRNQEQVSELLEPPSCYRQKFYDLIIQINNYPSRDYSVIAMSERCGMSARNFTRKFQQEFNTPPAAMVRNIRLELARYYKETTKHNNESIAKLVGFSSAKTIKKYLHLSN